MPVHFNVTSHGANPVKASHDPISNADQLLARTWGIGARTSKSAELLQSSFHGSKQDFSHVNPQTNGLVDAITAAYSQHHHLVIRFVSRHCSSHHLVSIELLIVKSNGPDDVWIAILSQLNFYVNAHAEELRSHFVAHDDQKLLEVEAIGTRYTVNFGNLAQQMTGLIDKELVDKDLKDWILPNFSTTTDNDTVISAVMMMATLKAYFKYRFVLRCGIPSVTLEGEKKDWEKLLARIEKLKEFGPEPTAWEALLRPILTRFVAAFDGAPDIDFWGRVCHYRRQGSGSTYLSGWITAFCVWTNKGVWQGPSDQQTRINKSLEIKELTLDGVSYSAIDQNDIPPAYCEVDVELDDNGAKFDCVMVSGHVGTLAEGELHDSIRPLPAWFMFIKEACEDPDVVRRKELLAQEAF